MLSGVILAGGANRRMNGEQKALLPFEGKPLIVRQLDAMKEICDELIVVTNDPRPYLNVVDRSVRIISDFFMGHGSLGGMHAALSLAKYASVWVVGCGMPFISSEAAQLLLRRKLEGFEAVVPLVADKLHPLHGIYDRAACAFHIGRLLNQGHTSVSTLLRHIFWSELGDQFWLERGIDMRFVSQMTTLEDYQYMKLLHTQLK
ncbi:molybdenum cofactor guanylyltransferase [Paenibacillus oryzisoli]|uniref:MobA-like NTP transferase domain-containing protein n=1 Tax=Paenibacillus oryzisoli TaxID=1850517 RepID=A0A198AKP5_9BACL|nr:molybdenum cofactor guanylyltransferase [Paenibacillus oryzisoli]OAS22084.1 hypothetical protein A8708_33465 [Paenibacillus oryzisoli]